MAVTVLLVDDHAVIRDGLRMILEMNEDIVVAGEAGNGVVAAAQAETLNPDVIIMDVVMPGGSGIEVTRTICAAVPQTRVIMLSMYDTPEHVYRAVKAGAKGYIRKEAAGDEVVRAIRRVMRGQNYFSAGLAPAPAACKEGARSPVDTLSRREREVLHHVVEGKTSVETAKILSLSPKSVETYRSRLMQKLGVDNFPALVKFVLLNDVMKKEEGSSQAT